MTAPDTEVLALFEQEAAERLSALSALLLELESDGLSDELVGRLFREAHTLKGAANVVGLTGLGAEAHALEDLFDHVRTGQIPVTPEVVDQMLAAVDRLVELSGVQVVDLDPGDRDPDDRDPDDRDRVEDLPGAALMGPELAPPPTAPVTPAAPPRPPSAGQETARVAVHRLDDIVRLAGESTAAHLRLVEFIRDLLGEDPYAQAEVRAMSHLLADLQESALRARMLPLAAAAPALRRAVRDLGRRTGKDVALEFRGEDTELDRSVHERLVDAMIHIVRNAVDHGIESPEDRRRIGKPPEGRVVIHAMQLGSRVVVTVTDDGRGVDVAAVRAQADGLGLDTAHLDDAATLDLLFHPGLTTASELTHVSGRGVGMDAVRESLAALRGRVDVESTPGVGTVFRLSVPITLTVLRGLVVRAGGQRYAIPLGNVVTVVGGGEPRDRIGGRPAIRVGRSVVGVTSLAETLGIGRPGEGPIVAVTGVSRTHAFCVDELIGERDVLLESLPETVPASEVVVGASAEPDGSVMLVLDGEALVDVAGSRRASGPWSEPQPPTSGLDRAGDVGCRRRVLVVDDALTVRELQRMILERAGYRVTTAEHGRDALERIDEAAPDLILTDVEMPGLDGLGLVREVRASERWANVPVVILTSRGDEQDRRAGLEAGADAYIVKSSFDEASLLAVVERLLGVPA